MTQPIVIYTNLFTLKDKPVASNKFIDMYIVWLVFILKYAKLGKEDICITFIDEETLNYMLSVSHQKKSLLKLIMTHIPNLKFIRYPQPTSIKEGMIQRYNVEYIIKHGPSEETNPYYLYLDVDVLVFQDIRKLFLNVSKLSDKTLLFLRSESTIEMPQYYGEIMTEEERLFLQTLSRPVPGFSSGIFGWNNNIHIREFMFHVIHHSLNNSNNYYTIDQPFFNGAVFNYLFRDIRKMRMCIIHPNLIAHNELSTFLNTTYVLGNYCGEPGNEAFHWEKIFHELVSIFIHTGGPPT